jgi:hypothetical protein
VKKQKTKVLLMKGWGESPASKRMAVAIEEYP